MTGIFVSTKAEAYFFLKHLAPLKKDGIFHYRGNLGGKAAALFLTRPGVSSPEQLRRFLRLYTFDRIVSTGTCASLTSRFTHLAVVPIAQATSPGKKMITLRDAPVPPGCRVVSVSHLVTKDSAKADLRAQTKADILDMETYAIARVMAEREFARLPFSAIRIVDDLPNEENYLLKEKMLREITFRTPSARADLRDILRFGLWDYFRISLRRHRVARAIFSATLRIITENL